MGRLALLAKSLAFRPVRRYGSGYGTTSPVYFRRPAPSLTRTGQVYTSVTGPLPAVGILLEWRRHKPWLQC